jgi:hypothetical protein
MLARALTAGVRAPWVTADEVYGSDPRLRRWLRWSEWPAATRARVAVTAQEKGGVSPEELGDAPLLPQAELISLTVPEVRHLLWTLVWMKPSSIDYVLAWLRWRRHHACAKRCYDRRHLADH